MSVQQIQSELLHELRGCINVASPGRKPVSTIVPQIEYLSIVPPAGESWSESLRPELHKHQLRARVPDQLHITLWHTNDGCVPDWMLRFLGERRNFQVLVDALDVSDHVSAASVRVQIAPQVIPENVMQDDANSDPDHDEAFAAFLRKRSYMHITLHRAKGVKPYEAAKLGSKIEKQDRDATRHILPKPLVLPGILRINFSGLHKNFDEVWDEVKVEEVIDPVEIDMTAPKGGQLVLQQSLGLAAAAFRPLCIRNAGNQRYISLATDLLSVLCNVKVESSGASATTLTFTPKHGAGQALKAEFTLPDGLSIPDVLQAVLPAAALRLCDVPLRIDITGCTEVRLSLSTAVVKEALLPLLKQFGLQVACDVQKIGSLPAGGGAFVLEVQPTAGIKAIQLLRRGKPIRLWGYAWSTIGPALQTTCEAVEAARQVLLEDANLAPLVRDNSILNHQCDIQVGCAAGISIFVKTDTGCILTANAMVPTQDRKEARQQGAAAASELLGKWQGSATVDESIANHLIPFMALAGGVSAIRCAVPLSPSIGAAMHFAMLVTEGRCKFMTCNDREGGIVIFARGADM